MMKSLKIYIVFTLCVVSFPTIAQQDPQYNQYFFNPLGINPAYAGSRGMVSAVALHRSQWVGFDGAPTSQAFAVHAPSRNKKMGFGLQLSNDKIGPKNTVSFSAVYAYKVKLGKGRLGFGLRSSLYNHQFNWNEIEYKDNDSYASSRSESESYWVPSFDFGVYYHDRKNYIGFELAHLNEGKIGLKADNINVDFAARQTAQAIFTAGRAMRLNKNLVFKPSVLLRAAENLPLFVDVNASLLIKEKLWLGASYRHGYGGVAILEYNVNRALRIGYSYDMALNEMYRHHGGAHEVFVGYDFNLFKSQIVSPRYF